MVAKAGTKATGQWLRLEQRLRVLAKATAKAW